MEKAKYIIKQYWMTATSMLALFLIYKFIADNKIFGSTLFPTVDKIGKAFQEDIGVMFANILSSLKFLVPSIIITLAIALGLGILMGRSEFVRTSLHPIVYAMSCVPSILLSPFLLLLCSSFTSASITLIIYGIIWSTLFATITGVEAIDKRFLDNAKTLNLKGPKLFYHVILPAAAPSIVGGFINSLRASFVMLIFAEMYGANAGLGYYVKDAANHGLYDKMWAGLIFMIIVVICVMTVFSFLKDYILRWTD